MTQTRWTPDVVAEVVRRSTDGMTAPEFADATDLSLSRAYRVLRRAQILGRVRLDDGGIGAAPARYRARDESGHAQ